MRTHAVIVALALSIAGAAAAQTSAGGGGSAPPEAAAPAVAPGHAAAARRLLEATRVRQMMSDNIEPMLRLQIQQTPQLAPYEDVLRDFLREAMDWKLMEPALVRLYAEEFTERELNDMVAFYRTPLGQKMLEKMPEIMTRSMEIGRDRVQQDLPKLTARLQERMQQSAPAAPPDSGSPRP